MPRFTWFEDLQSFIFLIIKNFLFPKQAIGHFHTKPINFSLGVYGGGIEPSQKKT
jgi:hypothetical protein